MTDQDLKADPPTIKIEEVEKLSTADLNDLCDATDQAIESDGGFGWVNIPARDILERFWSGVMLIPDRKLFIGRYDDVIAGTIQLILPPNNNEAQSFAGTLTNLFVTPWARGHHIARQLMESAERRAIKSGLSVLNLDVRETQKPSIALFEKLGYECWGTKPHYARVKGVIIAGHFYTKVLDTKEEET